MGITINSVKTHLKLANKALREELVDAKEYVMKCIVCLIFLWHFLLSALSY